MQVRIIFKSKGARNSSVKNLVSILRELASSTCNPGAEVEFAVREKSLRLMILPNKWLKQNGAQECTLLYDFDPSEYDLEVHGERPQQPSIVNEERGIPISCMRLQVRPTVRILSSLKKSLSMVVLYFGSNNEGSLKAFCQGIDLEFDLVYELIREPELSEMRLSNYHLVTEFYQEYCEVLQNLNFSDILLLPNTLQFRHYSQDICTSSIQLNPAWLKFYNYQQLMTKLGGRNVLRLNGAQFVRAVRYTRKMKKASLMMFIETDSNNNDNQIVLQIKDDLATYRRNIICQLLQLNQTERRKSDRQSAIKRNEDQQTEARVKQMHISKVEAPPNHPTVKIAERTEQMIFQEIMERLEREKKREREVKKEQPPAHKQEQESSSSDESDWNQGYREEEPLPEFL